MLKGFRLKMETLYISVYAQLVDFTLDLFTMSHGVI